MTNCHLTFQHCPCQNKIIVEATIVSDSEEFQNFCGTLSFFFYLDDFSQALVEKTRQVFGLSLHLLLAVYKICCCKTFRVTQFLMGMALLKTYCTEPVLARMFKVTEKTFRKYSWKVITAISNHYHEIVSHVLKSFLFLMYKRLNIFTD